MKKEQVLNNINPLVLDGICHRGLWNDELTENGMKAFLNAKEHNMAIELDVHLTKDNDLIVCHDSELKRTTSKEGIIEDLTVKEIKENYRLNDGEVISTLKEVFEAINEEVPIVVELKVYRRNYKALANRVAEELKCIKDKKNIMLISFDPRALAKMKRSGFIRQLLVVRDGKHNWIYMLRHLFESVDLDYRFLLKKSVQRYQRKHFVNVWTIETEELTNKVIPYCDTITFQKVSHDFVRDALREKYSSK